MWILVNKVDDDWRPFESTWRMDKYQGKTVCDPVVYLSLAKALEEMNDCMYWSKVRDDSAAETSEDEDYHVLEILPRPGVSVDRLIMETLTERLPDIEVDFHAAGSGTAAGFSISALSRHQGAL